VIYIDSAHTVQTSCGYAVPQVVANGNPDASAVSEDPRAYLQDRKTLGHWARQQIEKGIMDAYRQKMNARGLDGCGGLKVARRMNGENLLLGDISIWFRRTIRQRDAMLLGAVLMFVAMVMLRMVIEMLGVRVPSTVRFIA
jgi:hypothetical protein